MALSQPELERLEQDFLSGRNPLAFIPLCQALRRSKKFAKALELCQRGLVSDPTSVAGRTLLARLLGDMGRYEEALREASKAEMLAPEATGLLVEKARALLKLHRANEAEALIQRLNGRNPMDPEVQLLNTQLRQLRHSEESRQRSSNAAVPRRTHITTKYVLDGLLGHLTPVAKVLSGVVVPMEVGEPAVMGDITQAESALEFCREVSQATVELDSGELTFSVVETERCLLFIAQRRRLVICVALESAINFGKTLHRFQIAVEQLLPLESSGDSSERVEKIAP